jgi:hypothetical protein
VAGSGLKISFGGGSGDFVTWNGTGDQGQALTGGTYMVKVTQAGSGGKTTTTHSVSLLQANTPVFSWVAAAPNPVRSGCSSVLISLQGVAPGVQAGGQVFNLAGERVGALEEVSAGNLRWNFSSELASGVYIVQVNARDSAGRLKSERVKLAIVR